MAPGRADKPLGREPDPLPELSDSRVAIDLVAGYLFSATPTWSGVWMTMPKHASARTSASPLALIVGSLLAPGCSPDPGPLEAAPAGEIEIEVLRIGLVATDTEGLASLVAAAAKDHDGQVCMVVSATNNSDYSIPLTAHARLTVAGREREGIVGTIDLGDDWRDPVRRNTSTTFEPGERNESLLVWGPLAVIQETEERGALPQQFRSRSSGEFWGRMECIPDAAAQAALVGLVNRYWGRVSEGFALSVASDGIHPADNGLSSNGPTTQSERSLCEGSPLRFKFIIPKALIEEDVLRRYLPSAAPGKGMLHAADTLTTGRIHGFEVVGDKAVHYRPIGLGSPNSLERCVESSSP